MNLTNEQLTVIYNEANGIGQGKSPPITTERIFAAMRATWQAAQAAAVPEGWQLVPKEPTEDMCCAGESSVGGSNSKPWMGGVYTPENVELIYKDMLAAAPKKEDV